MAASEELPGQEGEPLVPPARTQRNTYNPSLLPVLTHWLLSNPSPQGGET